MPRNLIDLITKLYGPAGEFGDDGGGGAAGDGGDGDGGDGGGPAGSAGGDGDDDLPDDLEALRAALRKERKMNRGDRREAARLKAQLEQVKGLDPDVLREAQRKADEAERAAQAQEEQYQLRIQNLERKQSEALAKVTAELEAERQSRERDQVKTMVDRVYQANKGLKAASADGKRSAFDAFFLEFGDVFARDKQGLYVKDEDGDPMVDDETGKRLEPAAFLEKLRQDPLHSRHFEPEYGAGGGSFSGRDRGLNRAADLSGMSQEAKFKHAFARRRG
jgi:hypothetical protein